MARLNFDALFIRHPDGSLEPRQKIKVGGVTFGPGVRFTSGVVISGINFTQFVGRDFDVETDPDALIIKGVY